MKVESEKPLVIRVTISNPIGEKNAVAVNKYRPSYVLKIFDRKGVEVKRVAVGDPPDPSVIDWVVLWPGEDCSFLLGVNSNLKHLNLDPTFGSATLTQRPPKPDDEFLTKILSRTRVYVGTLDRTLKVQLNPTYGRESFHASRRLR